MSRFLGSYRDFDHPQERPARRRSRWFLAGGLAAGTLVVGAAGFAGVAALTENGDLASSASGSLPALVVSNDEDKSAGDDRKSDGSGWDGRRDEGGKGPRGLGPGDWDSSGAHHDVRSVPCDSDDLVAALEHANAVGGGGLKLAPKCTYVLTDYGDQGEQYGEQYGAEAAGAETAGAAEAADAEAVQGDHSGLPVIRHPISIQGEGATIVRAEHAKLFRFFTVRAGGELRLHDLTLKNGAANSGGAIQVDHDATAVIERTTITKSTALGREDGGGAIFNDGHTTVGDSRFTDNRAAGRQGKGGGILNGGVLFVTASQFSHNSAGSFGGGVANYQGAADISESDLSHNRASEGGGLASVNARTKLWDAEVVGNVAEVGAGILAEQATTTLRNLTVRHNNATGKGGGLATIEGDVAVDDSAVVENRSHGDGGGVFSQKSHLVVRHTEVSGNNAGGRHARAGGLFVESGEASLFASKVIENRAAKKPGGIFATQARVKVDAETVISKNEPTNCAGSPQPIENCFG
jgi:hypothetical protein